ncbi:MAG: TIGR03086 family metal-binding protein [Actinomycetota bacterium]|nr:TIGR03086 family metal-binding protein [Actinomycetota bacterium]
MPVSETSLNDFLAAIELFDARVGGVADETWLAASPCEGWTARDVVAHCVTNLRALGDSVTGGDFFATFGNPVEGEISSAWRDARQSVSGALAAAASGDTAMVGGNAVPISAMIDGLMRDLVIHAWDLGRATGGDEKLPDALVAAATVAMAMVGDEQRVPGLYGKEVKVSGGASAQDRLIALAGRQP